MSQDQRRPLEPTDVLCLLVLSVVAETSCTPPRSQTRTLQLESSAARVISRMCDVYSHLESYSERQVVIEHRNMPSVYEITTRVRITGDVYFEVSMLPHRLTHQIRSAVWRTGGRTYKRGALGDTVEYDDIVSALREMSGPSALASMLVPMMLASNRSSFMCDGSRADATIVGARWQNGRMNYELRTAYSDRFVLTILVDTESYLINGWALQHTSDTYPFTG